jgi:hypothetical protein
MKRKLKLVEGPVRNAQNFEEKWIRVSVKVDKSTVQKIIGSTKKEVRKFYMAANENIFF